MDELSDAGSIPARSTTKTVLHLRRGFFCCKTYDSFAAQPNTARRHMKAFR